MNGSTDYKNGKIHIPVFSFTEGLGEGFFATLGVDPGAPGELAVGRHTAELELVNAVESIPAGLDAIVAKADAAILLVKFLDQGTLGRLKDVFHRLNTEVFLPKSVVILRETKEAEFKMSCTYCGQKLWVRDRDAGRRGNCPQCRKTFFIPTQKSFVTSYLMLTDSVPVTTAVREDATCLAAVSALIERIDSMSDSVKSQTMRIELPPDSEA